MVRLARPAPRPDVTPIARPVGARRRVLDGPAHGLHTFGVARADDLALYYYDGCFYSGRVLRALADLGVEVELRDIRKDPAHDRALVQARGRRTVPVLRIRRAEGDEWLPESREIVRYLRGRFAPAG